MRFRCLLVLAVVGMLGGAARAEDVASNTLTYSLDTCGTHREVKTAEDLAALWPMQYRAGDTVKAIAPGGAESTLVSAAAADGSTSLPFNAGGFWTLEDSVQGTATFTVRHSLYGTLGDGTAASPAKIVDGDELADLANAGTVRDEYFFTLNGLGTLLADLRVPAGMRLSSADGVWRVVSVSDGSLYECPAVTYLMNSVGQGPNRRVHENDTPPVAYSGDNWIGSASAAATVTLVPPQGEQTILDLSGTGTVAFMFDQTGNWTVRLEMADGTTREAVIRVFAGFMIMFR